MLPLSRFPILKAPFRRDPELEVCGETVAETLCYLKDEGSPKKAAELVELLNKEVLLPFRRDHRQEVEFSERVAADPAYSYTLRFWYLFNLAMKQVMSDPFFRFERGGERLGVGHKVFEKGPLLRSPYSASRGSLPPLGIRGRNIKSCLAVLRGIPRAQSSSLAASSGKDLDSLVAEAGQRNVNDLLDFVNSFMGDRWITEEEMTEEDVFFDPEFVQLVYDGCRVVAEDEDFPVYVGLHNVSGPVKFFLPLLSGLDFEKGLRSAQKIGGKYANVTAYSSVFERNYAFISMRLTEELANNEYYDAILDNSWRIARSTMFAIAEKVYGCDVRVLLDDKEGDAVEAVSGLRIPQGLRGAVDSTLHERRANEKYVLLSWNTKGAEVRRLVDIPTLAAMAAVTYPAVEVIGSDLPLLQKIAYACGLAVVPVVTRLVNMLREKKKQVVELKDVIEQQQAMNDAKTLKLRQAKEEIQYKLAGRILTNAASLLHQRRYPEATDEFSNYLRHTVNREGLIGYSLAFFRTEGQLLLDVLGANIKVVAPGEKLTHLEGIVSKFYFKKYPDMASARRAKNNSYLLRNSGTLDIKLVFEDEKDHGGYVLSEEIHEEGRPGVRAPALLELHDEGRMTESAIRFALAVAARYYGILWERREDADFVEGSYDSDCERASSADLSETLRKCIGIKGSDEPLTAGLYTFTDDDRLVTGLESCLQKNAPPLLRIANSQKPMVAFDFTPRNVVYVAEGDQRLVDLDRINDLDMPRFFARWTEMSDFIIDEKIVLDRDVQVGCNTVYAKGAKVSSKHLMFCDFLTSLYAIADDSLKAAIDSDAHSWLEVFPVARFSKALRHFGSFSHWARKYANNGDADAVRDAKRHALNCLDNVVSSLDDVIGSPLLRAEEKSSAKELRREFAGLVRHLGVYGLSSDVHVHGSLSHCVAKHYNDTPSPATPVDESLALVKSRVEEKLDALKGRLEHVCIVEHTRFTEYGVPFSRYQEMIDEVFARHRRDFARLSFGLELDLVGPPEDLALDIAALDEHAREDSFRKKGISPAELSSADEILASVDALHVGLHYRTFRSVQGYSIKSAEEYAKALESSAKVLAGLKSKCDPSAFLLYVHQWKCAYDINKFNREDGRPERISYPSAAQLEPFFRVMYDNDLPFELNAKEISFAGNGSCRASIPILSHAIEYYRRRNAAEDAEKRIFFCRTSDIHNGVDRAPISLDSLYGVLPELKADIVVINR